MNKNIIISVVLVILAVLGLGWLIHQRTPQDTPTPTATMTVSVTPTPSSATTPSPNITITSPKVGESVDSPITVTGKARVFENQFTVQLKNSLGVIIYKQEAVFTDARESGQFGNYSVKIPVPMGATQNITVEALSYSAKGDGSFEGYASVAVKLKTMATSTVSAAFTVSDDCTEVTLYPRTIIKSPEPAYMSLVELLKGPNVTEKALGASTQIPENVNINSLRLTGDTIYADFDQALQQEVAGSCRVQAIRSQITNTLKQFPNIRNVVISINGKTQDILQP